MLTGLEVSPLVYELPLCFTNWNIMQSGDHVELNFEGFEMQNIPTYIAK